MDILTSIKPMIHLPIKTLLMFYDNPPKENGKHTTAITSVIGEDLGAGLLADYFKRKGLSAIVLNQTITLGTKKRKQIRSMGSSNRRVAGSLLSSRDQELGCNCVQWQKTAFGCKR